VRNLETEAATWDHGAVVQINQGGETYFRPALFVYALPGGVSWVEPSYLDPMGAATPAYHVAAGPVIDVTQPRSHIAFFSAHGTGWQATIYPADAEDPPGVIEALQVGLAMLKGRGTTWAAERQRLAVELTSP